MSTLTEEVELLRKIPLFTDIDPGKLKLLAFASERKRFNNGQDLCRQGDAGDSAFVIVEGQANVVIEAEEAEITVAQLGANEIIGEISILCDVPRTATIRACGSLEALKIKREHFLGLILQVPELGCSVMRELASPPYKNDNGAGGCPPKTKRGGVDMNLNLSVSKLCPVHVFGCKK